MEKPPAGNLEAPRDLDSDLLARLAALDEPSSPATAPIAGVPGNRDESQAGVAPADALDPSTPPAEQPAPADALEPSAPPAEQPAADFWGGAAAPPRDDQLSMSTRASDIRAAVAGLSGGYLSDLRAREQAAAVVGNNVWVTPQVQRAEEAAGPATDALIEPPVVEARLEPAPVPPADLPPAAEPDQPKPVEDPTLTVPIVAAPTEAPPESDAAAGAAAQEDAGEPAAPSEPAPAERRWHAALKGRNVKVEGGLADRYTGASDALVLTEEPVLGDVLKVEVEVLETSSSMKTGGIGFCAAGLGKVPDKVQDISVPFVMVGFEPQKWIFKTLTGGKQELKLDAKAWRPCKKFASGDRVRFQLERGGLCRVVHLGSDGASKGGAEATIPGLPEAEWHGAVELAGTLKKVRGLVPT